jgi:hypothetical protein
MGRSWFSTYYYVSVIVVLALCAAYGMTGCAAPQPTVADIQLHEYVRAEMHCRDEGRVPGASWHLANDGQYVTFTGECVDK